MWRDTHQSFQWPEQGRYTRIGGIGADSDDEYATDVETFSDSENAEILCHEKLEKRESSSEVSFNNAILVRKMNRFQQ